MENIKKSFVSNNKKFVDAIWIVENSPSGIALVINEDDQLIGTITDGDIRRAILNGSTLDSPLVNHMNINYKYITHLQSNVDAYKLMREFNLKQIPVIDNFKKVTKLIIKDEIITNRELSNPVLLMAGGKGKRLYPYTKSCPKPMLNINQKPILETQLEIFRQQGFMNFYISVNYLKEQIIDYFKDGSKWGVNINYLIENKPLGTAGCLKLLQGSIKESFLMINGDILTKLDFTKLINFHIKNSCDITICAKQHQTQLSYGVIETDNYELKSFVEKPIFSNLINAGIYVINPAILSSIHSTEFKDMPSLVLEAQSNGYKVNVLTIHEYWIDIGTLETYALANQEWN